MRIDKKKLKHMDAGTGSDKSGVKVNYTKLEQLGLYKRPVYDAGPVKINRKQLRQLKAEPMPTRNSVKVDLKRLEELGLFRIPEYVPEPENKVLTFLNNAAQNAGELVTKPAFRKYTFAAAGFAIMATGMITMHSLFGRHIEPARTEIPAAMEEYTPTVTYIPDDMTEEYVQAKFIDSKAPDRTVNQLVYSEADEESDEQTAEEDIIEEPVEIATGADDLWLVAEAGELADEPSELIWVEPENDGYNIAMADVDTSIEVWTDASTDSDQAGLLYKNTGGTILEQDGGWTKIESGELIGWVDDSYLLFDDAALEKAAEVGEVKATVDASLLNIRKEPTTESAILGLAEGGDELQVVTVDENNWAEISYNGSTAYVSVDYAEIEVQVPAGETIEAIEKREAEEKAAEEARKKAEEEAARKKAEAMETAETGAAVITETNGPVEAGAEIPQTTATARMSNISQAEINMLAAIIYCEAGNQPHEGKVAVGAVVLNRVDSTRFKQNTIETVIRAPGQFSPVRSGKFDRVYSSGSWSDSCYQAALDALAGQDPVNGALYFKNPSIAGAHAGQTIGAHVFW